MPDGILGYENILAVKGHMRKHEPRTEQELLGYSYGSRAPRGVDHRASRGPDRVARSLMTNPRASGGFAFRD